MTLWCAIFQSYCKLLKKKKKKKKKIGDPLSVMVIAIEN